MYSAEEIGRVLLAMRASIRAMRLRLTGSRLKVMPAAGGLNIYESMERHIRVEMHRTLRSS